MPEDSSSLTFDLRQVPFSTRGSWLDLSPVVGLHTTSDAVHLVSHRTRMTGVLRLEPEVGGRVADTALVAGPDRMAWRGSGFTVEAAFDGTRTVRLRGSGAALRATEAAGALTSFSGGFLFTDPVDGAVVLTSYETGGRYRIRMVEGEHTVVGDGALGATLRSVLLGSPDAVWEASIEETTSSSADHGIRRSFDAVVEGNRQAFAEYLDAVAPWRDERTPAAELAAYVLWSATVEAEGSVTRESVLMSKHWMDKVWSWDHCFNALALAPGLPTEALDQFLAPFDHQDEHGALPDSFTHSEVLHNYVKPPIHGWALRRLRATAGRALTPDELGEVYDRLLRWTTYWLDHRRVPGHALPHYHHGNDSGWDNATTFDLDRVLESPDLAAFLVIQLDVLAGLADELGVPGAAWVQWRDELLGALLSQLWTGREFVAVGAVTRRVASTTSLLTALPVVLGPLLPGEVREALAERVAAHLTRWGPATELPTSDRYEDDGYWRGPIWAPSTALVWDGLRACGLHELADDVSARFRELCEASGFAENFDARTGAGLRDRAYTWTAAVYLVLAADAVAEPGPDVR